MIKCLKSFHPGVPEDSTFPGYLGKAIYTSAVSQHRSYKSPPASAQGRPKNWSSRGLGQQPEPPGAAARGSHTRAAPREACSVWSSSRGLFSCRSRRMWRNLSLPAWAHGENANAGQLPRGGTALVSGCTQGLWMLSLARGPGQGKVLWGKESKFLGFIP